MQYFAFEKLRIVLILPRREEIPGDYTKLLWCSSFMGKEGKSGEGEEREKACPLGEMMPSECEELLSFPASSLEKLVATTHLHPPLYTLSTTTLCTSLCTIRTPWSLEFSLASFG